MKAIHRKRLLNVAKALREYFRGARRVRYLRVASKLLGPAEVAVNLALLSAIAVLMGLALCGVQP